MKLSLSSLCNRQECLIKDYQLPAYSIVPMRQRTLSAPQWLHLGAGNLFRAYLAHLASDLLNQGKMDTGLIVAEGYDPEIITAINRPCDDLHLLVTLNTDGHLTKEIIGSVAASYLMDFNQSADFASLKAIFESDSLQMVSLTITEKGYVLKDRHGQYDPMVLHDFQTQPLQAESYMGKLTALLYLRYLAGQKPLAVVSMDNCSNNGDLLWSAVADFVSHWEENGLCDKGFGHYIHDRNKVTFPCTMIDKITPRPDPQVESILKVDGWEDMVSIITQKNTHIAPFVNAEACEYLVIEDCFPNGRPPLEDVGVVFTDRQTVLLTEKMKVSTCLNPLHTALAIFGCLLGYQRISAEMEDEDLKKMVERLGYEEGLAVVCHPGILDPKIFLDTVIKKRLPNPYLPDTPQRIATDTSQKLAVRFGKTIQGYLSDETKDVHALKIIPLVIAAWFRYLTGLNDQMETIPLSADPLLDEIAPLFVLDDQLTERLQVLLTREDIFGVNLVEAGLSDLILDYFSKMMKGSNAVRYTLHQCVTH